MTLGTRALASAVTALRDGVFGATVFLTAFFDGAGFRVAALFFAALGFAVTFGLLALCAGNLAVATLGLGLTDFVFSARVFADFTVCRRAVVRDVERLRPFARVLMN